MAARWSPATRHWHGVGRLRNYGQSERYVHPELGMNSRLDKLQAALLSERLRWLKDFTAPTADRRCLRREPATRACACSRRRSGASHVHHLSCCDAMTAMRCRVISSSRVCRH
jgi:dTDP-4-amino-4,6-dideoxygalactose transaminase